MQDQHLTVGGNAGANADDWDLHGLADFSGQFAGYAFQQQHRRAGLFQCHGVSAHLPRLGFLAALHLITTEDVHRLRGEAEMGAYGYAALSQLTNWLGEPGRSEEHTSEL